MIMTMPRTHDHHRLMMMIIESLKPPPSDSAGTRSQSRTFRESNRSRAAGPIFDRHLARAQWGPGPGSVTASPTGSAGDWRGGTQADHDHEQQLARVRICGSQSGLVTRENLNSTLTLRRGVRSQCQWRRRGVGTRAAPGRGRAGFLKPRNGS